MHDLDKCGNPNCPHEGRIITMAFRGSGFCCDDCRKAVGADVSSVGTYMFLTTEEAELIRNRRSEAATTPIYEVVTDEGNLKSYPPFAPSLGEQLGHPGGHYG